MQYGNVLGPEGAQNLAEALKNLKGMLTLKLVSHMQVTNKEFLFERIYSMALRCSTELLQINADNFLSSQSISSVTCRVNYHPAKPHLSNCCLDRSFPAYIHVSQK